MLSDDGVYRYRLTRRWAPGGTTVLWIMLNPSVADAVIADATIRRCIGFSRKFGAHSLVVVNLFAYRTTDPKELLAAKDPMGPRNLAVLAEAGQGSDVAVAAWGALPNELWMLAGRSLYIVKRMNGLQCLGRTKSGAPKHPVRLPYEAVLQPWP